MADSPSRWSLEHSHCCCKIVFSCIPEAQPAEPQPLSMNIQRGELSEENAASTRINHSVESIAPPTVKVCGHRRRHAAWCSECMRASSKHIGDIWSHKRGNAPTIPECCGWKVDGSVDLLFDEFDTDSWSRINEQNAQIYKSYSSGCLCEHLLSNSFEEKGPKPTGNRVLLT